MKKTLLFLSLTLFSYALMGQCSELFISEYVEGYANNKALEIYNPTGEAIDLSGYSLARFSNGATTAPVSNKVLQLPAIMLESYDVFVVVVALTDTMDWNSQFDKPAWNGYNLIDTLFDVVTGEVVLDDDGNVRFGPQYLDGSALFGDEYNEEYDLQCKADAFLNPVYNDNNVMYFNGNDAMALLTGTEVANDGSNLIDVIGVIGQNPEDAPLEEDAWVNEDGFWLTKDRTLVRNADVAGGRADLNSVVFSLGGTFTGTEWGSYRKNSFEFLGTHASVCNTGDNFEFYSCLTGPYTSVADVNQIPFKMYPNPYADGIVTVESEVQIERVEIYNMLGQSVYNKKIGATNAAIELNQIGQGMYLVNLIFENEQISIQKLIVK